MDYYHIKKHNLDSEPQAALEPVSSLSLLSYGALRQRFQTVGVIRGAATPSWRSVYDGGIVKKRYYSLNSQSFRK